MFQPSCLIQSKKKKTPDYWQVKHVGSPLRVIKRVQGVFNINCPPKKKKNLLFICDRDHFGSTGKRTINKCIPLLHVTRITSAKRPLSKSFVFRKPISHYKTWPWWQYFWLLGSFFKNSIPRNAQTIPVWEYYYTHRQSWWRIDVYYILLG